MYTYLLHYIDEELKLDFEINVEAINAVIDDILGDDPIYYETYIDLDNYIIINTDDFYTIDPEEYII